MSTTIGDLNPVGATNCIADPYWKTSLGGFIGAQLHIEALPGGYLVQAFGPGPHRREVVANLDCLVGVLQKWAAQHVYK